MRSVSRRFGNVEALRNVDLAVQPGEAVALLGHNGSGKTTLARIAAGELAPTSGDVRVCGCDPHDPRQAVDARRSVAFLPASGLFYADLTVREHMDMVGAGHGVEDLTARIAGLLETYGLTERADALPDELSTGTRQKTMLATALLRPADVLVLDEPVANLDETTRALLATQLAERKAAGTAIVIITHQLAFADGLADRGVVLSDGALVDSGRLENLTVR